MIKKTALVDYAEIALLDCRIFEDQDLADKVLQQLDETRRHKVMDCERCEDQRLSLGVGALARALLLRHGIDLTRLRFTAEGRPVLEGDGFFLSLSHAGNFAMAGLSTAPIGVDLERLDPGQLKIADHFFSPEEQQYVQQARDSLSCFYSLWSRKESLIKRNGLRDLRELRVLQAPEGCCFYEFPLRGYSCVCCVRDTVRPRWHIFRYEDLEI